MTNIGDKVHKQLKPIVAIFFFSAILIEVQFPELGLNIGNIAVFIGSLSLIIITKFKNIRFSFYTRYHLSYLLFLILCLVSTAWSASKINTIILTLFTFTTWYATLSISKLERYYVISLLIKFAFLTAILSFLMIFLSTELAFQPVSSSDFPELRGIFKHQQRLGLFMAFTIGIFFIAKLNNDLHKILERNWYRFRYFVILVIVLCCIAAFARSYSFFVLVSLILTIAFSYGKFWRFFIFIFLLFAHFFLFPTILEFLDKSDADLTLTGRTTIWTRTIEKANEEPIIGHGFVSFDSVKFDSLWGVYRPPHAHNSFLQVYFDLGFCGVLSLFLIITSQYLVGIRFSLYYNKISYSLFLVFVSFFASLTGVTYAGKPSLLLTMLLIFISIEGKLVLSRVNRC